MRHSYHKAQNSYLIAGLALASLSNLMICVSPKPIGNGWMLFGRFGGVWCKMGNGWMLFGGLGSLVQNPCHLLNTNLQIEGNEEKTEKGFQMFSE